MHRPAPNPWGIQTRGCRSLSDFTGAPCTSCARVRTITRTYVYTRTRHSVAICVVIYVYIHASNLKCFSDANPLRVCQALRHTLQPMCMCAQNHRYVCIHACMSKCRQTFGNMCTYLHPICGVFSREAAESLSDFEARLTTPRRHSHAP